MSSNALATRNLNALLTVKPFVPTASLERHIYQLAPFKEGSPNYNALWGEYQGDGEGIESAPLAPVTDADTGEFVQTLNPAFIDSVGVYTKDPTDPRTWKFNLHLTEEGQRITVTCGLSSVGAHYAYASLECLLANGWLGDPVQIHAVRGTRGYKVGQIRIVQDGRWLPTDGWEKFDVMKKRFKRALLPFRNAADGGDPVTQDDIEAASEALAFYEEFNNEVNHVLIHQPIVAGDSTQAIEAEVVA